MRTVGPADSFAVRTDRDTLLIQGPADSIDRLNANRDFIVTSVVGLAALDVLLIAVAALAGALLMVVTGCLDPTDIYDAVQWDVVFLLAGVIPLGIALENTGGADSLAVTFAASTAFMTPVGYQTNRFVYGPGGYRFTDYLRVGTPLQLIFTVVTTLDIAYFWPL